MKFSTLAVSLLVLVWLGCDDTKPSHESIVPSQQSSNTFSFLTGLTEGRSFMYSPGSYQGDKTIAFLIDRHNVNWRDSIFDWVLHEKGMMASDSASLKTIVLVYNDRLPVEQLIQQQKMGDSNAYHVCYLSLDSMIIRKVVRVIADRNEKNIREKIAKTIVEGF